MKNSFTNNLLYPFLLMLLVLSQSASARKIYPVKGSDGGIFMHNKDYSYGPGDTLVLRASQSPYIYFSLENMRGNAANPIVIINEGGQVSVNAMGFRHCSYMKITGSGSADQYGFYMTNGGQTAPAISINGRSANMEVERVDIYNHGYGFWVKEESTCIDSINAPNWVIDNISIHHNRAVKMAQEGVYAGSTAPNGERTVYCNGVAMTTYPMKLGNIKIYNNIFDQTNRSGIQVSNAQYGNNEIWNNTVTNCGSEWDTNQGNGILIGGYTTAYVHDNTISNTFTNGIFSLGAGLVRIENNKISNSGNLYGNVANGQASIMIDTRLTSPVMNTTFHIKNNSFGSHTDANIRIYNTFQTYNNDNIICNNTSSTGAVTWFIPPAVLWTGCAGVNQVPVVNAGPPQTITLPQSYAYFNATATDVDGTVMSFLWTQVSGPITATINGPTTPNASVNGLTVAGTYVFRCTATDNAGGKGFSDVTVTVLGAGGTPAPAPAPSPTPTPAPSPVPVGTRIEAEAYTAMFGIQTEPTSDAGGGLNIGWQDTGDWMDYSVNVTTAGTYTVNFRVSTMFNGPQFQLRNSSGSVLATVNVPNTGSFQAWRTVSAQVSLPAGQQTLRIHTSNAAGGWNINWWEIAASTSTQPANQPPTANAGTNQTITLPTSSTTLSGTGTDSDGTISSYTWSQVSGPNTATITTPSAASTTVSGLIQGSYVFRLTVQDNSGATATSDVTVTVNAATTSNTSPASGNQKIEAEAYTAMFGIQTETTSDVGGGLNIGWQDTNDWMDYSVNVSTAGTYTMNFRVATMFTGPQFQVRNASGTVLATLNVPNTGSFQTWQTISAQVSLPAGQQTLRIHTSNAAGGWNFNWFEIVGGSSTQPANQPPTVNAGADQTITLPTSSLSLNGTASDPDGTIASYTWSQVSGPNTATFSSASSASTTVSGLVQGTYVFRLTVKDNQNATATDDVSVTVNAAPATSTSIKIEAEHYKAMFGIKTENTSDVGGGLNVGWQDNNDWMDYSVNMSSAGTYTMNFRVASQFTGPQFQVRNSAGTVLATVTVPNTGGFQTWRTISAQVTLPVGQQTLRIHTSKASGGWNINWFEIMGSGTATENESTGSEVATLGSMDTESALEVYPNPIQDRFTLTVNNNLTGSLKIEMINMSGVVVKTYQLQKTTEGAVQFYLSAAGVATGTYVLKATMQNWTSSTQVVKE